MREHALCDALVVLDEVALRDPVGWEHDLVRIGDGDLVPVNDWHASRTSDAELGRGTVWGRRIRHGDAGALEHRRDEIALGKRAHECSHTVDHGVRDAPDSELRRKPRKLVRLDADRPDLR